MHRLINQQHYRMASTPNEANAKIDPDNVYLWRIAVSPDGSGACAGQSPLYRRNLDATWVVPKSITAWPHVERRSVYSAHGCREGSRVPETVRQRERDGMLHAQAERDAAQHWLWPTVNWR